MKILSRFFGRKQGGQEEQMERIAATSNKIVQDYGAFMQSRAFPTAGCIADTKKLPYDKAIIKKSIMLCIKVCGDFEMKNHLTFAYLSLADFQDGVGLVDVGFDIRNLPHSNNIDAYDHAQADSVCKQMDTMMGPIYKKFKPIAEDERRRLQEDLDRS